MIYKLGREEIMQAIFDYISNKNNFTSGQPYDGKFNFHPEGNKIEWVEVELVKVKE